jgi:hypothetical protein
MWPYASFWHGPRFPLKATPLSSYPLTGPMYVCSCRSPQRSALVADTRTPRFSSVHSCVVGCRDSRSLRLGRVPPWCCTQAVTCDCGGGQANTLRPFEPHEDAENFAVFANGEESVGVMIKLRPESATKPRFRFSAPATNSPPPNRNELTAECTWLALHISLAFSQ